MTGAAGSGRQASVAAVAVEVEALRKTVGELSARLADVDGRVPADLGTRLQELADRVEDLAGAEDDSTESPSAFPSWFDVSDPQQAAALLRELIGWVTSVLRHYPHVSDQLNECWMYHPDVIETLLALYWAWCHAYRNPKARATSAADWRFRLLPLASDQLKQATCMDGLRKHQPAERLPYSRSRQGREELLLTVVDEFAAWWVSAEGRSARALPPLPDLPPPARPAVR